MRLVPGAAWSRAEYSLVSEPSRRPRGFFLRIRRLKGQSRVTKRWTLESSIWRIALKPWRAAGEDSVRRPGSTVRPYEALSYSQFTQALAQLARRITPVRPQPHPNNNSAYPANHRPSSVIANRIGSNIGKQCGVQDTNHSGLRTLFRILGLGASARPRLTCSRASSMPRW